MRKRTEGHRPKKNQTPRPGQKSNSESLPPEIDTLIASYIRSRSGLEIADTVFLSRVRQAILAQKAGYWKKNPSAKYGRLYDIYAYLGYHLPVYYMQAYRLFSRLEKKHRIPDRMVLLDVGAGPGVVSLAAITLHRERRRGLLELYAVERSAEHILAYQSLVHGYAKGTDSIILHDPFALDLRQDPPPAISGISVLTIQNVLAEFIDLSLKEKADLVMAYVSLMTDDGLVILTEPAEFRHATLLRELQNELIGRGLYLHAPCSYPWGARCHPTGCWTFWETSPVRPTTFMEALAADPEGYRYTNTDVKSSFVVLTRNPPDSPYRLPKNAYQVRLSHLRRYTGRAVCVIGGKLSGDIGDRRFHLFKICDGTCKEPVFLVLPRFARVEGQEELLSAGYGDLLLIDHVQVRWNPEKRGFNLVLGEQSSVRTIHPGRDRNPDSRNDG